MAFTGLGSSGSAASAAVGNMAAAMAAADGVMAEHPGMLGGHTQIGVSNDNDPEKEALQKLVKSQSMAQDIPDKLARGANDLVATGATTQELQRISAVLEAVELRGGADAAHADVHAKPTPNAPAKGGMDMALLA